MQIDEGVSLCPGCGGELEFFGLLHHMACAYVGPAYDFTPTAGGYACPKCTRAVAESAADFEIVGTSARCRCCHTELVVAPMPPTASLRPSP